jgi:Fanconi anemia group M protein
MVNYIEHPLIIPNTVEARIYQQILAVGVLKKGNTMVVAPTALGKTIIAVLLAADRLNKFKSSKILILAPSKPLTIQHEESFRNFLNAISTSITGAVKTNEREKRWNESQVICATPQTVESDLLNKRYSLEDVSLILFDESHHAVGSYAYVYLAARYMNEGKFPLILALTASPGSDSEKIKNVCENLYIEDIAIKSEDDADVIPYFNPIEIDWIKVKMSKELIKIREYLDKILKHRLTILKNTNIINSISVGKKDILKARSQVQNRIARSSNPAKKCYKIISIITEVINIQHSIELLETQGIKPVNQYFEKLRSKPTKAAKNLINDPDFNLAIRLSKQALNHGWEHPKLKKLMDILSEELHINESKSLLKKSKVNKENNPKIIVFTQFRDTLSMIHEKCQEKGIKSVKFYGQGISNGEKGLSQKEQKQIIKSFKAGTYDVLISTSVAEEGIDIPSVDLVVLYEPVPSEIRMIQRRGRTGRKDQGKMKVLITAGTRDEGYYWSSIRKEKKMKTQLTEVFKNINLNELKSVKSKIIEKKTDNEETSPKKDKVVVYADSREINSKILRYLDSLSVDVQVKTMSVADYQVSDNVAIERKTAKDFIDSIVDKRLYKQARLMKEEFEKPVMILEGDDFYGGFLKPDAIRGAFASIAIDFGIPIIPTKNSEDTAAMIKRIAIREQAGGKTDIQVRTERKPVNVWEQQLFIIESLPHIGSVSAKKLLEKFGTVENVINADDLQLQEVAGIGKKTAKDIKSLLSKKYLYFDDKDRNKKLV